MSAGGKIAIILGALVLVAALAVCAYGFVLMGGNAIYPNVYIAGISVGGLNREAALAAVRDEVSSRFTADTLTIVLPDQTVTIDSDASNIALDADEAVDAAMTYGRNRGPISAILTYRRAQTGRYDVNLTSSLDLDTEYIRSTLEQAAAKAEKTLVEPSVNFDEATKTITVVTGSPAVSLDVDKLYDAVLARYDTGNFSDLNFDYDTTPCNAIDLKPYYDKYCTEMVDAYYDEEKHELVPEVKGFGFDLEYYTQQIAMADAGQTFTIQMKDLVPEVTLESLEKEYFSTTLAKYDSPHVVNADRTKNLELACAAIDGTILNPGEIFSFNKVVGERTPEKGYRPATIYQAGGKSEAETGGGVCQVASTIYEAVLYADLDVVERAPHMFTVTYVDMGQDATIYWGSLDFKFKNSTKHPIRIDASVSGGYVHIALVGTAEEKSYDHVKMTYTTLSTTPWKTVGVLSEDAKDEDAFEITVDAAGTTATDAQGNTYTVKSVLATAYSGSSVVTYRHFMDKDNNELSQEKVASSVYTKRDRKLLLEPLAVAPEIPDDANPDDYDENGNYIGDPSVDPTNPGASDGDSSGGTVDPNDPSFW